VAALRGRRDVVFAELEAAADAGGAGVVLHGDAHAGNLMRSGGQWLWLDLEETCRGPRHWDLAVLARSQAAAAEKALAAYAAETGTAVPGPDELAPYLRARELEGAVWSLAMAHQYPARYREPARSLLDSVLGWPAS
jgi:aminoglycoside phosphotransferase (APT) family kinase protein